MKLKEVGKRVVFLISLILLISSVSAMPTYIKIKTLQYHNAEVIVADGTIKDYSVIAKFKQEANEYGDVNFSLNTEKSKINIYVTIKKFEEEILKNKSYEVLTGKTYYWEFIPEGFEAIPTPDKTKIKENVSTNQTANESVTIVNNSADKGVITGGTMFGEGGIFSGKKILYILGGILLALIIIFLVIWFIRKRKNSYYDGTPKDEIRIKKMSDFEQERRVQQTAGIGGGGIEEAERKIKEAQAEINRLKSEDRIKEMKKRIQDEEKELMRMRAQR